MKMKFGRILNFNNNSPNCIEKNETQFADVSSFCEKIYEN